MSETDRGDPHGTGRRIAGHAQDDHRIDPYHGTAKPKEGMLCPECGAAFHAGRWQWGIGLTDIHHALCPACRRIRDDQPAGIVELEGGFVSHHKEEIINLARNLEALEKAEHPMNRIMRIHEMVLGLEIRTTDIHLPRRIGEALKRAYDGALTIDHDKKGYFVRVRWERND
jgi:NMD protein affecting ribosome stability and mRNA decay